MNNNKSDHIMEHPFPKSTSLIDKCRKLWDLVVPEDVLGIIINADPDSIASAMALKRFFWRKIKRADIYHINTIKRADNLAMIKLLKMDIKHVRKLDKQSITKWAIVDSQPDHSEAFGKYKFDIIIDHHPVNPNSTAKFMDIKEEFGANSTILTEYLRAVRIKPSPKLATAMFYGIKTDTDNFVRESAPNDINAFRYLYKYANISIIKKIESSEITRKTIDSYLKAMNNLHFVKDIAFIHMGKIDNPDILVIMADFFLKMAEATWAVVSGIHGNNLTIIIRNAGFRLDAGKIARKLFGEFGTAGGHKSAARVEINLNKLKEEPGESSDYSQFVLNRLKAIYKRNI